MRVALLAGLLALTAGCTGSTDPGTGDLSVLSGDGILRIQNDLREPAFYFVHDRAAAAAIDWAPCVEPSRCLSLAPGTREPRRRVWCACR
jgi:hypothetical protein